MELYPVSKERKHRPMLVMKSAPAVDGLPMEDLQMQTFEEFVSSMEDIDQECYDLSSLIRRVMTLERSDDHLSRGLPITV